ncbi:MAG: zinc ribbon domain-containing protein, partial [Desulfobacterales bacterium]
QKERVMPIYEFLCENCCCQFEELVLTPTDPPPKCPGCQSEAVKKIMSAGAIRPKGIATGAGGFKAPACKPAAGG